MEVRDPKALATGIGLVVLGAVWSLTGNPVAAALTGFGAYLIAKGLLGEGSEG